MPRLAIETDRDLLAGYAVFCATLPITDTMRRARLRAVRAFLAAHPDLEAWLARPLTARLADLRRIRAWPLLSYLACEGTVRLDIDLLLAKDLGGFGATAERYAKLASPTLRAGYDAAIGKVRRALPVAPVGRPIVPERVAWIASEFLKTRVATGFCSRHLAGEACPYANVCETCDNFVPAPQFVAALRSQLADIREPQADASARGWTSEVERHGRVIESLEGHLRRLENEPDLVVTLDTTPKAG